MRTLSVMTLIAALALVAPAFAQSPTPEVLDVDTIIHHMKTALEPPRSSVRRIDLITHTPPAVVEPGTKAKDIVVELKAWQARKKLADSNAILTVMVDPPSVRGLAYLVREDKEGDHQWLSLPSIRRVRKISGMDAQQPFLGTDFTDADMGFVNLRDSKFNLLGQEAMGHAQVFKVEEVPANQWYFSRIITWVDMKTMLPMGRDFYDMANQLWKTERIQDTSTIDGTPTIMLVEMKDRPAGTSTELRVSEVHYDAEIPDALFDPSRLPQAVNAAIWKTLSK